MCVWRLHVRIAAACGQGVGFQTPSGKQEKPDHLPFSLERKGASALPQTTSAAPRAKLGNNQSRSCSSAPSFLSLSVSQPVALGMEAAVSSLELPSQVRGSWAVLASVPLVTTGRALGAWPLLPACSQHKAGEDGLKSHPLGACGDVWGQQLCPGDGVCFSVPCPCRGTRLCPRSAPSQRREHLFLAQLLQEVV